MIKVKLFKKDDLLIGFSILGHAEYSDNGDDIVCAAVSMLTINTINTFEEILEFDDFSYAIDNMGYGLIDFELLKNFDDEKAQLLLKSFELGVNSLEKEYNEYIEISYEGV